MDDLLIFLQEEEHDLEANQDFFDTNYSERIKYLHTWVDELHDTGGFTYLEALADFCTKHDVEYEKTAKYISEGLKQKIFEESIALNLLKKGSTYAESIF